MKRPLDSLGPRFYLAILALVVAGVIAFGLLVAREAGEEVRTTSSRIVGETSWELETVFDEIADAQADLLEESVRVLAENFGRELQDVPFELYRGKEDELRDLLAERLGEMRRRHAENSAVIAGLFRRDEGRRVTDELERLTGQQDAFISAWSRATSRDLLIFGGAFLLGVGGLIALVFAAGVLRPLREATGIIETMRGGELGVRIPVRGRDEIARLATSFNAMADAVESARQGLEEKVAEKTRALRDALDEQQATNARLEGTLAELESTRDQLVESAKMAALGTMAQGMAHEFNNILGGIRGCAEELRDDETDPERRELLDVVVRTASRASVITRNLTSFSRGGEIGERRPASLAEIAGSAARLVEPEATRLGVALSVEADALPELRTDPRGVQQIVLNLVINAVQASAAGDRVTVGVRRRARSQMVEVVDRGSGIEPDIVSRVFEPFFTTKSGTSAGSGGTGLGLAVSHGLARRLGGTIEVESAGKGRGATFRLVLPETEDAA